MSTQLRSMLPTTTRSTAWRNGAVLAGLALGACALYVRAKSKQAEREYPPQGKFVEVDGVRLHYVERGQGPALVLLHGNITFSGDYEESGLLERAAANYRVIVFDRPGYGYSERPRTTVWTPENQARLLHHALQEIGVDSALVVGHSWGTLVALAMALEVPDFVRGLVLLSGYYYPSVRLDVPVMSAPAIPIVGDLLRYTLLPIIERLSWPLMAKTLFAPLKIPERFRALPPWLMLRPGQLRASGAESALMVPSAIKLARRYPDLKVPAALIHGTRDLMTNFGHNSERLHERIGHSTLELQPGVGHMTHYAHPDKVMEAIDAMAAQVGEPVPIRSPRAEALARASESGV